MRLLCLTAACISLAFAQRQTGELRITVLDPSGLPLAASAELVNQHADLRRSFSTDPQGQYSAKALPFGIYRLRIDSRGFAEHSELIEVRSEVPLERRVTMTVSPISTELVVADSDTLLDPHRTGVAQYVGKDALREHSSVQPARGVLDMVNMQPGWLLEANGVLHPRGSEYQVQYVIDGLPVFDNRSPAFASALDADDFQSMNVLTGNYPAEYGRKLGGVVEVTSAQNSLPGFHGSASVQGGSFATESGYVSGQYSAGKNTIGLSADGSLTDRYLDPPVIPNFTNHAGSEGFAARFDRDWTGHDRINAYLHYGHTGFLVPNEQLQQDAGQREDRTAQETLGRLSYQHIFSPNVIGNFRTMARDVSASLWSNPLSTPIRPSQDRGFRESYWSATVSAHYGAHELKAGAEAIFSSVHENFGYEITAFKVAGVRIFDRDTPRTFQFSDRRQDREQSGFVQDLIRKGNFTFSAGLRWDRYSFLVDETAWSPRLGIAWSIPRAGLVLRASYDRAFQTPAIENLLLAASPAVSQLNNQGFTLPLRPSRGNFYEAGFSKSLFGKLRLDATAFRRDVDNYADDDLLLNTGVSFPIAFAHAQIHGYEAKLAFNRWGNLSGFLSYSNLLGVGQLPIAGGLFLDDAAAQLLQSQDTFAISQDQRNSVRAQFRYQLHPRVWAAAGAWYGSGLPVELGDTVDIAALQQQYGQSVIDRVNFDRGRVRPSASIDVSVGATVWNREKRAVRLQSDLQNLTNRLNLINFAGLFSGTAVSAPRSFAIRLQTEW